MLILSILIICFAHFFRVLQWELFVSTYEKPRKRSLLQALSFGYIANYFLPFKVGDLLRAYIAGRKMKNGKGFALATVIIDRCLDVIVVGIIFGIFSILGIGRNSELSFRYYTILAVLLIIFITLVYFTRNKVKVIVRFIAGLFNPYIEERILRFSWALIWSFKDILMRLSKVKLLIYNISMWILYIISYWCFGSFLSENGLGIKWTDIFISLFAKNSIASSGFLLSNNILWYSLYYLTPSIILILISLFVKDKEHSIEEENECLNLLPHINEDERRNFLELYFSGKKNEYIKNYLDMNRNILILRDYSAGSNATTILCTQGGDNFFRKYAFDTDADKLYEQILWLKKYQDSVPLPEILRYEKTERTCYYDMPYNNNAIGLFSYTHSSPYEYSWEFMRKALECLELTLYKNNLRKADKTTITKYVADKVDKNIDRILKARRLKNLMKYEDIIINGIAYKNLPYYLKYLSIEHLEEVFMSDMYSDIHGDLTIENIICVRNQNAEDDFYIIDPNTGNVHDSSNLDYAKLLQSIHGNYEFLMATTNVESNENHIDFTFIKSDAYAHLWKKLDTYMRENFSKERVKSIYYHEIIHWLRLLPYKIEKNGKRALLFYAGLLMVLSDIVKWFEEE